MAVAYDASAERTQLVQDELKQLSKEVAKAQEAVEGTISALKGVGDGVGSAIPQFVERLQKQIELLSTVQDNIKKVEKTYLDKIDSFGRQMDTVGKQDM